MAARTYKRDSNGRFASGSGGSSGGGKSAAKKTAAKPAAAKPAAKPAAKKTAAKPAASKPAAKKTAAKKPAAKPAAAKPAIDGRRGPRGGKTGTRAEQRKAAAAQAARSASFRGKAAVGRSAKAAFKAAQGAARKAGKAPVKISKVDLTDAGFTRRLGRAKALLRRAQAAYAARGSSAYDTVAKRRVQTLESAVSSLSYARKTVRSATVPASKIKTTDRAIIDNYNKQLAATKRKAASTPFGERRTTAPKLTRSEKASATRARNKAARDAEQRRRWEQSRRYS